MLKNILRPLDKNHRIFPLKGKVKMALPILPFRGRIEVGVGVIWRLCAFAVMNCGF
jgi:hypothetical protein